MSKNPKDPDLPRHSEPQPGASVLLRSHDDGDVTISFSDGSDALRMNRRDFMRVSGVAAATAAMTSAACREPVREIVPYVDRPEDVRIGVTNRYASVCEACPSQCGILVKSRAGRPFKLEGNPQHPINQGGLCARGQASYMDLYDPDRLRTPVDGDGNALSWDDVDGQVAEQIAAARNGASLRILTGSLTGPATQGLIDRLVGDLPNARHYTYEPLASDAAIEAAEIAYGQAQLPNYRFDRAELVVSLGSDFLGTWLSPVEFARQFASGRDFFDAEEQGEDDFDPSMNRLVTFEPSLSLTGINADDRFRVRPDDLAYVAMALAHELYENHGPTGIPANAMRGALDGFDVESVADHLGDTVSTDALRGVAAELANAQGRSIVIAGGVASATAQGIALESAVNLLNAALGNDGETIDHRHPYLQNSGGPRQLQELVAEIEAGDVDTLIVADVNPVYAAPAGLDVAGAFDAVDFVVSTATHLDETAQHADLVATGCHYLEAWGDSNPRADVYALRQPAILPLFETRSLQDSLLTWFGDAEADPELATYLEAPDIPTGPRPGGDGAIPYDPGPFYRFLRDWWEREIYGGAGTLATFNQFWESVIRDGHYQVDQTSGRTPRLNPRAAVAQLPESLPSAPSIDVGDLANKQLHLFASVPMYDGRQANNGHLQELPDPITRHTWGSYAMVGYRTFEAAGLESGQLLEITTADGETLSFPVIGIPGLHEDVIAIPLGYGRSDTGTVGNDVGANAFRLAQPTEEGILLSGLSAEIRKTDTVDDLSVIKGAGVLDVDARRILGMASFDEFSEDQSAGVYHSPIDYSLWEDHDFGDLKWGMAIDMTKCTGCSACVVACQEENNIPVVGRQGILEGREMHWLRMDRYYRLPDEALEAREGLFNDPMYENEPHLAFGEYLDEPRVVMQAMLCQHCDKAPCESVCPVLATMQSSDGLNQMSYQRCVGTRYCSNNCPYKVRRYNWFNYGENRGDSFFARLYPELKEHGRLNQTEPMQLALNPDVTVRTRGVMEKCTFCVQRIRRSKWDIMKEGRRQFHDGEVVTACQESCPADAIYFGNVLDDEHRVTKMHKRKRAMFALSDLDTQPAIAYMTSVFNTEEDLA